MRRSSAMASAILALVLGSARAGAQAPIDDGTRATARRLAEEAGEDLAKGDAGSALDKYTRADALVHLPTLSLRMARCLEKLGRFVEASELYVTVTHMEPGLDPRGVQAEAKQQAETEGAALAPRIPALVLRIDGAPPDVAVTLDGKPFPRALFGVKRLIDPGAHELVVRAGAATVTRALAAKPGEVLVVPIDLASRGAEPPAPAVPAVAAPAVPAVGAPAVTEPIKDAPPAPPPRRVATIVIGSLGSAGLIAAAITGGLMFAKKGAIGGDCVNKGSHFDCNAAGKSSADAAKTFGLASTVAVVAGATLVGAAIVLRATEGRPRAPATASRWIAAGMRPAGLAGAVLAIEGAL